MTATGETIDRILSGTYPDPDGGPPLDVPTRSVVIADTLAGDEAALLRDLGFGGRLAVVSDPNTWEALGERVTRDLDGAFDVLPVRFPAPPHADTETVEQLRGQAARADAYIAVGSGTINDLCKYAAARDDKPYAVFATAPSMNGYTSVNASITVDGHKHTVPARGAEGVFMDLGVLAAAPRRMIVSGLGDSLARPTAQADWLLSHLLLDTPYREAPFAILSEDEDALFAEPDALVAGDLAAMARLARTLVLSGFGMTICRSSAPASQGEHLISHYMDMCPPAGWPGALHGEQVGLATLSMSRVQQCVLEGPAPRLAATDVSEQAALAAFGPGLAPGCVAAWRKKAVAGERVDALNDRLSAEWNTIRGRIAGVTRPASAIEAALLRSGGPVVPADLGLDARYYASAVLAARMIRDRYTFLDLACDSGTLTAASAGEF